MTNSNLVRYGNFVIDLCEVQLVEKKTRTLVIEFKNGKTVEVFDQRGEFWNYWLNSTPSVLDFTSPTPELPFSELVNSPITPYKTFKTP